MSAVLGRQVFTILTEPDTPTTRLLIMAHGFRGSSTGPAREFVDLERLLVEDGIACLRFDQPGSGNSDGDFRDSSFNVWIDTIAELACRYRDEGCKVALLGQSMGGAATLVATSRPAIQSRLPAVILWSPGVNDSSEFPDRTFIESPETEYVDEGGQRVRSNFWRESHAAGFFGALDQFGGAIHVVFGEHDHFDPEGLRHHAIARIKARAHEVNILPGQDHSSWDYDVVQQVYELERAFLRKHLM
jgi:pimeloyl-ACP methyl ester carboxylesterase